MQIIGVLVCVCVGFFWGGGGGKTRCIMVYVKTIDSFMIILKLINNSKYHGN